METITIQVLQTMGRWFAVIFLLLCQAGQAQTTSPTSEHSVWHDALFIFCLMFFVVGFVMLFILKIRDERKSKSHTRYMRQRSRVRP